MSKMIELVEDEVSQHVPQLTLRSSRAWNEFLAPVSKRAGLAFSVTTFASARAAVLVFVGRFSSAA
jgi:hypothetical protein